MSCIEVDGAGWRWMELGGGGCTVQNTHLLNTYREALEDKLKKVLVITDKISALIEEEQYETQSQTAMDIERKNRKEIETLKSFIHKHRRTRRTNNTVEEEITDRLIR